ncbi:uncharacterized protein [Littorina saxatilis]|uniref:uncharacterized protein n=1 Tax=Littorina saxatilis TaxID=31220 RepID=UPI0038B4480E
MTTAVRWLRLTRKRHMAAAVTVCVVLVTSLWVQTSLVMEQVRSLGEASVTVATTGPLLAATMTAPEDEEEEMGEVMTSRWKHYQGVCDVTQGSGGVPGLVQNPLVYLPANLSLCWVPKVGCTFWMRIFFYLHNDTESPWNPKPINSPFDIDRLFVHFDGGQRTKNLRFDDVHEHDVIFLTRRVMFARDPWSRLWSGYIDKFVLPDSWLDHGKRILRKREELMLNSTLKNASQSTIGFSLLKGQRNWTRDESQMCSDDVSFAEFLHYALVVNQDPHWSPVHLTCNPCLLRPQLVGKMDTFFQDAAYVLRTSGLGHLLPESSRRQSSHVMDEVKLLADYHFRLWDRRQALKACLDRVGLARRLWRAFQLNGYIPNSEPYPEKLLTDQLNEFTLSEARDIFTNHVISVSSASSLSRLEWLALRRRTMMAAYREVPIELLKLVQERFKLDFELFQYNPAPGELFVKNV